MNLSVLIHTFNGYNWLWGGCIEGWKANYDQDYPIYFGTDTEPDENTYFWHFKVLKSGEGSWSDRLSQLLSQIGTKYVFYAQEDHWPIKTVPNLGKMMQLVEKYDLLRLHLAQNHSYYTTEMRGEIGFFDPKSKYLVSHQPSIWDREFLMSMVSQNETPWINEYEGTKRLNNDPKIKDRIGIYPVNWFHHACVKGKMV